MRSILTRIEVHGAREAFLSFKSFSTAAQHGMTKGLYQEAEKIMTAAKRQTPVDTGALRASGHVKLPEATPDGLRVEMGFGGPAGVGNQGSTNAVAVGYAIYVHERLDVHHRVGKARFLSDPTEAAIPGMRDRIAHQIHVVLEGSSTKYGRWSATIPSASELGGGRDWQLARGSLMG